MTFLEWFGPIALTVLLIYLGLAVGFFVGVFSHMHMEGLAFGIMGAALGSVAGVMLLLFMGG